MKLYTEEQVNKAMLDYAQGILPIDIFNSLTPIELPSDEELKKQFDVDEFDPYDLAYLGGAISMINLIQEGNK